MEAAATATTQSRYTQLEGSRISALFRARECALYTIPMLMPPEGATDATKYSTPYQSLGARGVNNLASKLVLALFPPNSPFFRYAIDDATLAKLGAKPGMKDEIEKALAKRERSIMLDIETTPTRAPSFEALKHLLVTGNYLLFMLPTGGLKGYRLDQYVCKRDPSGHVLELITKESLSPFELPDHAKVLLGQGTKSANPEKSVDLYTHVKREDKKWTVHQEIKGQKVPGSDGSYPLDKCPWISLRFIADFGADYGRSFVEEYLGDLKSLEGLTKSIVQHAAVAAKVLFLVKPNSTTRVKDVTRKESGEFVPGNAEDITVLSLEKFADMRVAFEARKDLQEALSFAFLLNTAVQRKGERVTAEEIRFMANELEAGLGGFYSTMSQEFQLPFVTVRTHVMETSGKLQPLPKGIVKPMITTGVEAIGRGNDFSKLQNLLAALQPLGPEVIATYLNVGDYITRASTAIGIESDGLIRTPEEVAQAQQAQQMQQMVEKLGPNAVTQVGGMAKEAMASGGTPAAQPQS